jgi:transcriptional regulator with XRE-family HTH domain
MFKVDGMKLAELRKAKGWTQAELARGICTPSMVSQIECGKANPSVQLIRKLEQKLGVAEGTLYPVL